MPGERPVIATGFVRGVYESLDESERASRWVLEISLPTREMLDAFRRPDRVTIVPSASLVENDRDEEA